MEEEGKTRGKSCVEVVRVPWYEIVAIEDVGISGVPDPVHKTYGNYVVGDIDEDCYETNGEWLAPGR